jgi:protein-tyrosine-phosphatase
LHTIDRTLVELLAARYDVLVNYGGVGATSVCFLCRFNRARSVMAATMFAEQLRRCGRGDLVKVSSAGTAACVGGAADERIHAVLVGHGYPAPATHRATQLGDEHLGADLVVALGYEHVSVLQQRGVDADRIRYVEVRNPCFGADFEVAFDRIEAAMPALHTLVDEQLRRSGVFCPRD